MLREGLAKKEKCKISEISKLNSAEANLDL
jgi:hypothetical protein